MLGYGNIIRKDYEANNSLKYQTYKLLWILRPKRKHKKHWVIQQPRTMTDKTHNTSLKIRHSDLTWLVIKSNLKIKGRY